MKTLQYVKWVEIIIIGCTVFIISCRKIDITPTPTPIKDTDVFKMSSVELSDGQSINFNLNKAGRYTLTLQDSLTNQVVSREKFIGKLGINNMKIYTKTLQSKYLYLLLKDSVDNQIGKTTLNVK